MSVSGSPSRKCGPSAPSSFPTEIDHGTPVHLLEVHDWHLRRAAGLQDLGQALHSRGEPGHLGQPRLGGAGVAGVLHVDDDQGRRPGRGIMAAALAPGPPATAHPTWRRGRPRRRGRGRAPAPRPPRQPVPSGGAITRACRSSFITKDPGAISRAMFSYRSAASKAKARPAPSTRKLWCPGVWPGVLMARRPGKISVSPSRRRQSMPGSSKSMRNIPFSSGPGWAAPSP